MNDEDSEKKQDNDSLNESQTDAEKNEYIEENSDINAYDDVEIDSDIVLKQDAEENKVVENNIYDEVDSGINTYDDVTEDSTAQSENLDIEQNIYEDDDSVFAELSDDATETPISEKAEPTTEADIENELIDEQLPSNNKKLEEPFETKNAAKISLIGGKGIGKTYLFQSMVYRALSDKSAGALSHYLDCDAIRLVSAISRQDPALLHLLTEYLENYEEWQRLPATLIETQRWFRLELPYRKGIRGTKRSTLAIEFYDGAGEFFEQKLNETNIAVWETLTKSNIVVFCLPFWVVFPDSSLSRAGQEERLTHLRAFHQVLLNYKQMRKIKDRKHNVFSILALTQADDARSGGSDIIDKIKQNWIEEYSQNAQDYLKALCKPRNVLKYLKNSKIISKHLLNEMESNPDPKISSILSSLDLGRGKPWLMPVSAINGKKVTFIQEHNADEDRIFEEKQALPIPIHVELPLLVALCEYTNALI